MTTALESIINNVLERNTKNQIDLLEYFKQFNFERTHIQSYTQKTTHDLQLYREKMQRLIYAPLLPGNTILHVSYTL